jgi:hypothetical protein
MASPSKLSAEVRTHECRPGVTESVILATAPGGRAYVASVFSRMPLKDRVQVKAITGGLRVQVGQSVLNFRATKRHLQLTDVT